MSVWRVIGTETEYGISVPGNPGANAMLISSQVVNAYSQPSSSRSRRARWDFEEESPLRDARGFDLARDVADASQLTDEDVVHLADTATYAGFCPTTERDLGDGIGPGRRLHDAGVRLTLGSDSHAVVDPFEELRALELDERLATQQRGHWSAAELLAAGTRDGQASLGWDDAGEIAVGHRADLVTLDTASPRTAGTGADAHTAVFAAAAADVPSMQLSVCSSPHPFCGSPTTWKVLAAQSSSESSDIVMCVNTLVIVGSWLRVPVTG